MTYSTDLHEMLVERFHDNALALIAMGETRSDTKVALMSETRLTMSEIDSELANALRDALRQGIEREDIDESWFDDASPNNWTGDDVRLSVNATLGNEAFRTSEDAARALRKIADQIEREGASGKFETIYDDNGNDVGRWKLGEV